jgi:hypothetical protein
MEDDISKMKGQRHSSAQVEGAGGDGPYRDAALPTGTWGLWRCQ